LHAEFIRALEVNAPLFLETNMTLPEKAEKVKSSIRYVAGDFKLRNAFKDPDNYEEIREATIKCYRIFRSKGDRDCFCKVVIKGGTDVEELLENVEQVKDYISCVILQPLTPFSRAMKKPLVNGILDLQESIAEIINDVRIIPQTHKMWGAL
jgi:organic radical activating enzyme